VRTLAGEAGFVLTMAMFQSEVTGWSHLVLPGTSYLERDGTFVNLEGRPQRLRRAVVPEFPDELEWLAALGERFEVLLSPWPAELPDERAELPPRATEDVVLAPEPAAQGAGGGAGMELVRYRPLFSGAAVERVPELQFQRPVAEVELAPADAHERGISGGETVRVSSNGTSQELRARINRRLRPGVARVAEEHAQRLERHVEVTKA
jgi:predicted molibdopterin-dependent oxidoreductase YjgC